jgi:hypothetical protein
MKKAPGLGGIGATKQDKDNLCSLCNSPEHETIDCKKRKGCGKCRIPKLHTASKCQKPYPKFDKQICDECLGDDHEVSQCKSKIGKVCEACGHGDHATSKCPVVPRGKLTNNLTEDQLNQFTPIFRQKYLDGQAKKPASAKPPSSSPTLSSQRQGVTQSPQKSPRISLAGLPIIVKGSGASAEENDPIAARRMKWEEAEKGMPKKPPGQTQSTDGEKIKGNFFAFKIGPTVKLFRYSITLGDIRKKDSDAANNKLKTKENEKENDKQKGTDENQRKLKKETKRFLIESLLIANSPAHDNWATDYDAIIVSRGSLYHNSALAPGQVTETHHHCTGPGKDPEKVLVESYVTYLGEVNLKGLKGHVEKRSELEYLTDILKSLNIISWQIINHQNFQGGRVGNRFYPQKLVDENEAKNGALLYRIRDGYFSSMRPGDGSLLLNVNSVTSAFFSPINLQIWIKECWGKEQPHEKEFKSKLKGIRVTFNVHKPPMPSRIWIICGISKKIISETTFKDKKNKVTKVSTYLKESKSCCSMVPRLFLTFSFSIP